MIRKSLFGLTLLCAGLSQAQAADDVLTLTGAAADLNFSSFVGGNLEYTQASAGLSGLDSSNALSNVAVGDTITATVTFDGPVTLAAFIDHSFYGLNLTGTGLSGFNTATDNDTFQAYLGGVAGTLVASGSNYSVGTSEQISNTGIVFPPNTGAVTFDTVVFSERVSDLSGATSVTLNSASFEVGVANPVPEPSSTALLFAGIAAMAGLVWRRRPPAGPVPA